MGLCSSSEAAPASNSATNDGKKPAAGAASADKKKQKNDAAIAARAAAAAPAASPKFPPKWWAPFREVFLLVDETKNGKVTLVELKAALQKDERARKFFNIGDSEDKIVADAKDERSNAAIEKIFNSADKNKDGFITWNEFIKYMAAERPLELADQPDIPPELLAHLNRVFQSMDKKVKGARKDGEVNKGELVHALREDKGVAQYLQFSLSGEAGDDNVEYLFREMDQDNSGTISWNEFLYAVMVRQTRGRPADGTQTDMKESILIPPMLSRLEEDIAQLFRALDRGGDRALNHAQFRQFLNGIFRSLGMSDEDEESFARAKFEQVYESADKNKDSVVQWGEFWTAEVLSAIPKSKLKESAVRASLSARIANAYQSSAQNVLHSMQKSVHELFNALIPEEQKGLNLSGFTRFVHELFQAQGIEEDEEVAFVKDKLQGMFSQADTNDDKLIQWEEFWKEDILAFIPPSELSADTVKREIEGATKRAKEPAPARPAPIARVPRIIIAGAPASGKGTQCENIRDQYGVVHISTGDLLRAEVNAGTELGLEAKEKMERGDLVPDQLIVDIVLKKLRSPECKQRGWLLDGFPRTRAQADALSAAKIEADVFILLDVPDEALVERVVGRRLDPETGNIYHLKFKPPPADIVDRLTHRADDTAEKVIVRIKAFHDNIGAIQDCYKDIMVKVNGNQAPSAVFDGVVESLSAFRRGLPPSDAFGLRFTAEAKDEKALVAALKKSVEHQKKTGHDKGITTLWYGMNDARTQTTWIEIFESSDAFLRMYTDSEWEPIRDEIHATVDFKSVEVFGTPNLQALTVARKFKPIVWAPVPGAGAGWISHRHKTGEHPFGFVITAAVTDLDVLESVLAESVLYQLTHQKITTYAFSLSEDKKTAMYWEVYPSSEAFMTKNEDQKWLPVFARLRSASKVEHMQVFGAPNDKAREFLASRSPTFLGPLPVGWTVN